MTGQAGVLTDRWSVVTGLRQWAAGVPADEAAVELLVGLSARFTSSRRGWVRPCRRPGWFWLDPGPLNHYGGRLRGSEQRVLALVVTLLGGQPSSILVDPSAPMAAVLVGRTAA